MILYCQKCGKAVSQPKTVNEGSHVTPQGLWTQMGAHILTIHPDVQQIAIRIEHDR
jgi:hypothetical protein